MIRLPLTAAIFSTLAIVTAYAYSHDYGDILLFVSGLCVALAAFFLGWWSAEAMNAYEDRHNDRHERRERIDPPEQL